MAARGKFDTNTAALKKRIYAHEKYGSFDINNWIYDHFEIAKGSWVLDLGCGIGKQTIPMAQRVGNAGRIIALDVSQNALDTLYENAKKLGVDGRITLMRCDIDDLDKRFRENVFDCVLGSYSVYYSKRPSKVFSVVHRILKPGGVFFFCGPAKGNNLEIRKFHYGIKGGRVPPKDGASMFMEKTGKNLAQKLFDDVRAFRFQNPLRFNSPEALYDYWSSYNLYDESIDSAFRDAAAKYFKKHSVFKTIKRVVGIKATKQPA